MTSRDTDWDGVRLHVVTGKGGTGKTTVAGALALALSSGGKKVLLMEVEGRQGIAQLFDVAPLPYAERRIAVAPGSPSGLGGQGGDVFALVADPESALVEYLEMFYGMRHAGTAMTKLGVMDFATTIAPGLRDVLLTGKAAEAVRRKDSHRSGGRAYDAVVMDAPPTGRIGRFLNVTAEVSGLAKVGPIRGHADTVQNVIRSPQTVVHFVTVLEEMPVQETLDGIAELHALDGIRPGAVMVNMTRPVELPAAQLTAAAEGKLDTSQLALGLKAAGLDDNPGLAEQLGAELSDQARTALGQDALLQRLAEAGQPCYELPWISDGMDLAGLYRLAAAQPVAAGGVMTGSQPRPALDVDRLIDDRRNRILVCCGSGGVGKTTTAAAIGVRAAERGRHVVVLTVDPARRLAQSMGLTSLDNTPRLVQGVGATVPLEKPFRDGNGEPGGGSLHAMMLDMKRTFDEIVEAHADPDRAAQILANPFYQSLSSSFAGTQEYMAMEKLGQLSRAQEWDLIVVDTPPSRSALDFLDAPQRLARFLDGRLLRLLVAPAKVGGRAYLKVLNAGFGMVTGVLTKILGTQVLRDMQTFVSALDTMFGGFRERADFTYQLLRAPGTAFLVVAAPEPDALREASYFVERLAEERMPLAGLILNRVQRPPAAQLSAARSMAAAEMLEASAAGEASTGRPGGRGDADVRSAYPLTVTALRLHADRMQQATEQKRVARHFTAAHPLVPVAEIPAQPDDIHDLDGLRRIGQAFGSTS